MTVGVVANVEAIPFRIPLRHPARFSTGVLDAVEHVLVKVTTDEGAIGWAEAPPRSMVYGETLPSVLHAVREFIGPAAVGVSVLARERFAATLRHLVGNPTARSAVELAMWDAAGRLLGIPCAELLGGYATSTRVVSILHLGTPEEMAQQAQEASREYGISSFKVKATGETAADLRALKLLRETFDDGVAISVDANGAFDVRTAPRFLQEAHALGVSWVEEPLPRAAAAARADLLRRSPIPFLADESCPDLPSVVAELERGACSMVSIKVARTGITASENIRALCEAQGAPIVVGSQGDSEIGAYANAAFAVAHQSTSQLPSELLFHRDMTDHLTTELPLVADGLLHVPERPGFGFEVDESQVQRYRL